MIKNSHFFSKLLIFSLTAFLHRSMTHLSTTTTTTLPREGVFSSCVVSLVLFLLCFSPLVFSPSCVVHFVFFLLCCHLFVQLCTHDIVPFKVQTDIVFFNPATCPPRPPWKRLSWLPECRSCPTKPSASKPKPTLFPNPVVPAAAKRIPSNLASRKCLFFCFFWPNTFALFKAQID